MGFGDAGEATVLASGRTSYYFRRSFTVTDVAGAQDLRLDLLVDDGAAVYVNGTEVVRTNLPTGTLTDTTRAVVGLSGNAEDTFRSFAVPASALVEGVNTIAVEVHQNAAASSDLSFDARLSAVRSGTPPPPPPVPVTWSSGGPGGATGTAAPNRRRTGPPSASTPATGRRARRSSAARRAARPPSWSARPAPAGSGAASPSPTPTR